MHHCHTRFFLVISVVSHVGTTVLELRPHPLLVSTSRSKLLLRVFCGGMRRVVFGLFSTTNQLYLTITSTFTSHFTTSHHPLPSNPIHYCWSNLEFYDGQASNSYDIPTFNHQPPGISHHRRLKFPQLKPPLEFSRAPWRISHGAGATPCHDYGDAAACQVARGAWRKWGVPQVMESTNSSWLIYDYL